MPTLSRTLDGPSEKVSIDALQSSVSTIDDGLDMAYGSQQALSSRIDAV
ncbi:hypothetical protein ACW9I8_25270 [Pseudomonas reactans]|uniref:Uncharacterized protein n=1 Tax=Pseudomonas reactans TaxID=117680 RepID=A0A7Y7ZP32_9PSED|nr:MULTISPECIES: hypothetical protein [Pseudomonas]NWA38774.1 hypothetical protein [Pseudomonas reactans]NWC75626.1 hypothetical protein [Pseudomonas sp. P7759]NWC88168.1 hypothetical protein [Pseudomonas reactans]NWD82851.1 hypothetical protein [Pseudomonas reactans]NWD98454.1 hypothetical protein [Pseudomonas reactans]